MNRVWHTRGCPRRTLLYLLLGLLAVIALIGLSFALPTAGALP